MQEQETIELCWKTINNKKPKMETLRKKGDAAEYNFILLCLNYYMINY